MSPKKDEVIEIKMAENDDSKNILLIEPFYGGSHKQLVDLLTRDIPSCTLFTQTAKKWHWRARTSALHFAFTIPECHNFKTLFCSSVLNLAEFVALRPDMKNLKKIVYFHENQLVYPVRKLQERDFQYGYNQILTCLVADVVLFNSHFNMDSFLSGIKNFMKTMPDYRPKDLADRICPKCRVLYFPMDYSSLDGKIMPHPSSLDDDVNLTNSAGDCNESTTSDARLHILWPHRWEHDKDPEMFFEVLFRLQESGHNFKLSILGQSFEGPNPVFDNAKIQLSDRIEHWGYVETRDGYLDTLSKADLVISTAKHEFFGVAMLEAVYFGCFPLCPNRLVYPEIYPVDCLYKSSDDLLERLKTYCKNPNLLEKFKNKINTDKFSWDHLRAAYLQELSET